MTTSFAITDPATSAWPTGGEVEIQPDIEEVEEDPDSILASLEAETEDGDEALGRESRAQRLADQLRHARQYQAPHINDPDDPTAPLIQTLANDDQVLRFTTQNAQCLVHFSHPDFARCGILDLHLRRLAERHGPAAAAAAAGGREVPFGRVDARECGFVVERLGVRTLPCLVGFADGVVVGRMVGFDAVLGGNDIGERREDSVAVTKAIEALVVGWGVFAARTNGWGINGRLRQAEGSSGDDDDDDDDSGENDDRGKGRGPWIGGKRKNGGLFGKRGIQGRKQGVTDGDDDDWD